MPGHSRLFRSHSRLVQAISGLESGSRALQTGRTSTIGPAHEAAVAAWARLPGLAIALTTPQGVYLVLDPGDGRVLHASSAALALAAALSASDGAALARQIAQAGAGEAAPRLARLRLDSRRIAPPALCLLARVTREGGEPAILMVPAGPVTLRRRRLDRPAETPEPAEAVPEPSPPAADPPLLKGGDRFVWRSDASGTLTTLTGADGLVRIVGRSWHDLAKSGALAGADTVLAALADRRTFRATPAALDFGGGPITLDLSGAPLGRGASAFSGFGGFGVIRSVPTPVAPAPAVEPVPAETDRDEPTPQARQATADARLPAVAADRPAPVDPALSTDEHAAFREIARALGARYAGDDESAAAPSSPRPEGGAVMPFPGLQPDPPAARADAPDTPRPPPATEILAGLPLPALVHRGATILATNRPFLDVTGFADRDALAAAGIGRLFRGLMPEDAAGGAARRTVIEAADGRARPVEILRGDCTWEGEAAACLILRPLDAADAPGALAAERLAREAQAARAASAEAALDAVDAGVVTIDGAGRVMALNRAAAGLSGGDPREVVGGSFLGLFDRDSVLAVADALRGRADTPRVVSRVVSVTGSALTLRLSPAGADGRRVAVLDVAPPDAPAAPPLPEVVPPAETPALPGTDRTTVHARLDRALRVPMTGIVDLTDAMLREPFGPLGDPRYRRCLTEIRASGERMLERVTELLDLAAVEAGALVLDPRPLALNEVVAGCVARLQPQAARGRIVLRTSFSADLDALEADEPSVSRAACLVIEHAIRRSAAGGQVIVSTGSADSAGIALRVRDMGAGATRPEPGPPEGGSDGLGLALTRALVEANGGRLRLSGRADEGTLVEIILPVRRAAGA